MTLALIFIYQNQDETASGWSQPIRITEGIIVNQVFFTADGRLLFTGNNTIFLSNADGTDIQPILGHDGVKRVAMSPDGSRIVFDDDFDIFIVRLDGRALSPIANDPDIFEFASSFSPDGERLVFVTIDDKNLEYGIWIMDSSGSNRRNILSTNESVLRHSRWSPDGTKISYFTVVGGKPIIWVMDSNGDDRINLTSELDLAKQVSWSNDGKRFVYSSKKSGDFDIWTMNTDGGDRTQITNMLGDEVKPVWSPDGERIAFVCSDCFNKLGSDLYIISKIDPKEN